MTRVEDKLHIIRNLYRLLVTDATGMTATLAIISSKNLDEYLKPEYIVRVHRAEVMSGSKIASKVYIKNGNYYPLEAHIMCDLDIKGSIIILNKKQSIIFHDKKTYTYEIADNYHVNKLINA